MISNEKETVTSLTEYVASEFHKRGMLFNNLTIQKVIYKIKMDLDQNQDLYNELPYYWYYHGPYSELVNDSFNKLIPFCRRFDDYFSFNHSNFNKNLILDDFS